MGASKAWEQVKDFFTHITVEPVLFLFSLSHGLTVITSQSLYINKVCSVNFNHSRELCANIYAFPDIQIEVQKYVSVLQAWNSVLQAIPAVVYALFAGPWSDKHGRRTLILMSCVGYFISNGVYIINVIWWNELKAEYLLFECLQDCTGGYTCFYLGCYSYIADVSDRRTRTRRLGFLDGLFPIGFFTGMAVSGIVMGKLGMIANFLLGTLGVLLTICYTLLVLKDSRKLRPPEVVAELKLRAEMAGKTDEPPPPPPVDRGFVGNSLRKVREALGGFFNLENLKKSFTTTFRRREYGVMPFMILSMIAFLIQLFMTMGKGPTYLLFFRKEFKWNEKKFGQFIAMWGFIGLFTQYVIVPILTKLGMHDALLGLIAVSTSAIENVIVAFASEAWQLYLGGAIAFMNACGTTVCRSMVTKCVSNFEVGAAFSVMAAFQALIPVCAAPLFGYLYKATIETFPGAFLIFSACGYVVAAILLVIIFFGLRRADKLKALDEVTNEAEKLKAEEAMMEQQKRKSLEAWSQHQQPQKA